MTGIGIQCIDIKSYDEPSFIESEILRYAKCDAKAINDKELMATMHDCMAEVSKTAKYNVIYKVAKIRHLDDSQMSFDFGDCILDVNSKDLAGNFLRHGSNHAVFFAATLGHDIDRLIRKYSAVSPAKALFMQAIGAERIEALCDAFEDEVRDCFARKAPRFSPGFGDLTLELQRDFARILDMDKKMGIKVGENLLMSPSKSVTAIIGVCN